MFIARNIYGEKICARCGVENVPLTKDHFIPKSCGLNVNEDGNLVAICRECNQEKADKVVMPEWYVFLKDEQREKLLRYMRYARSYMVTKIKDEDILKRINAL